MDESFLIIGGGVVGMAVAYGLARSGCKITVLDGGDDALRASRGNAGLTWVQGKGVGMPRYAELSMDAVAAWPQFADELKGLTGIDLQFEKTGGVDLCFTEEEAMSRQNAYVDLQQASPRLRQEFQWSYLDRSELASYLPGVGKDIYGGTYSPHDGQCQPLHLLRALHAACRKLGGQIHFAAPVTCIEPLAKGFRAFTEKGSFEADRIILAVGLGAKALAGPLGLTTAVRALRGQVLVTERLPVRGLMPTPQVRQMSNGCYLIGDTHEDAGFDTHVTLSMMQAIAAKGIRCYPFLKNARLVRAWSALRIMTPDGYPLYDASKTCPGAYLLNCHSGITLAPIHAGPLSQVIRDDRVSDVYAEFSGDRFHV